MKYQFESEKIKSCCNCPLLDTESGYFDRCNLTGEIVDSSHLLEQRPENCPLSEVEDANS